MTTLGALDQEESDFLCGSKMANDKSSDPKKDAVIGLMQ